MSLHVQYMYINAIMLHKASIHQSGSGMVYIVSLYRQITLTRGVAISYCWTVVSGTRPSGKAKGRSGK